jgi:hypothetical protein
MDFNSMVCGVVGGVSKVNRCKQRENKGLQKATNNSRKYINIIKAVEKIPMPDPEAMAYHRLQK